MAHDYSGDDITVHFDGRRCIHARECVLGLPNVFTNQKDWIKPNAASAHDIMEIAHKCPSGAISYTSKDHNNEALAKVNTLRTKENGPLEVRGDIQIDGEQARTRAVLCRCGLSRHKPYCDNSHIKGGFTASGECEPKESEPLDNHNGPLMISPRKDGPYLVIGNLEIISGSGRQIDRRTKAALCRCGHSKNKPYCDGSHKAAGFQADGAE